MSLSQCLRNVRSCSESSVKADVDTFALCHEWKKWAASPAGRYIDVARSLGKIATDRLLAALTRRRISRWVQGCTPSRETSHGRPSNWLDCSHYHRRDCRLAG